MRTRMDHGESGPLVPRGSQPCQAVLTVFLFSSGVASLFVRLCLRQFATVTNIQIGFS